MSGADLDFRHPEQYLQQGTAQVADSGHELASMLGQQYRETKNQLKEFNTEKQTLARQVATARNCGGDCKHLIEKIEQIKFGISESKKRLKLIEASIQDLLTPPEEPKEKNQLPPQFLSTEDEQPLLDIEVTISECNTPEQWQNYINQHPRACVYHSLNTRAVITRTFGHQSLYLIAQDTAGNIRGVLPLIRLKSMLFGDFFCSMPFFNYGGVLADHPKIEEQLLKEAELRVSSVGSSHIEYRHCSNKSKLACRSDKVAMLLALPGDTATLWENIGSKLRAQIKKAQRFNTRIATGRAELADDFYRVFSRNMRDLGTPVYPRQFFINILQEHDSAHISIVYLDDNPVAAGFTLGWRNTLEIPWASTLKSANPFNVNMLLYWHILGFAVAQGYQVFDFGRSSKGGPTYQFKKQWGAQEYPLYWHYWLRDGGEPPVLNPHNPKFRLAVSMWQKLPLWLANWLGPHLVRNLP